MYKNRPDKKKRRLKDADAAFRFAVASLSKKGQTTTEIRRKLKDRGASAEDAESAIQRCLEYGYLDDARFLAERGSALLRNCKKGGFRAVQDLTSHGISFEDATSFVQREQEKLDLPELLRERIETRYAAMLSRKLTSKEYSKIVSYFTRRGFSYGLVTSALNLILKTSDTATSD